MVRKEKREPALMGLDETWPPYDDPHVDGDDRETDATARQSRHAASPERETRRRAPVAVPTPAQRRPPARPGDQIVPRQWRQWYSHAQEHEIAPLVVDQPKRRRWGRMIYLVIVLAGLALGANMLAGEVFWYNAKGTVGGLQYPLSPTQVATVTAILVHPGERVHKGQVLVRVDSPQLSQQAAQTSANIAGVKAQLRSEASTRAITIATLKAEISGLQQQDDALQQQYSYHESQVASMRQLYSKGVINYGDLSGPIEQQMQTQVQSAQIQAKLRADRAQLKLLKRQAADAKKLPSNERVASLEQVQDSLNADAQQLSLRAPVNGIVAQIPVTSGQTVHPGEATAIIVPDDRQRTLLYFPPAAQARLSAGQTLNVTTPNGNNVAMQISHVYPSVQDLPADLRDRVTGETQKVVVAARPVNSKDISQLSAGTPVTARVSRWSLSNLF